MAAMINQSRYHLQSEYVVVDRPSAEIDSAKRVPLGGIRRFAESEAVSATQRKGTEAHTRRARSQDERRRHAVSHATVKIGAAGGAKGWNRGEEELSPRTTRDDRANAEEEARERTRNRRVMWSRRRRSASAVGEMARVAFKAPVLCVDSPAGMAGPGEYGGQRNHSSHQTSEAGIRKGEECKARAAAGPEASGRFHVKESWWASPFPLTRSLASSAPTVYCTPIVKRAHLCLHVHACSW